MLTKVADIPQQMLDIYSKLTLMSALPRMYFRQFVEYKLEFGLEPGERIMFTALDNLPKGGKLKDEDTPIPKHKMSGAAKYISLDEFGNGTSFSRRASKASLRNMMNDARNLLSRDYSIVFDEYLRDIFLGTANKYYVKADGSNGTSLADVAGKFDGNTLDALVEKCKDLNMPKLQRGADQFYAFIGTSRQIRQMRNSAGWLDARRYVDPSQMLNGESGRLNDVIFFDTTQMPKIAAATAGTLAPVHRGVLIGAMSVGLGESVPMELIPEQPEDFGRKQPIAWYSIAGAGILNDYLIEVNTIETL